MNCEHITASLSRYYDGEMNESESCQCAAHIRDCASCRCALEKLQSLSSVLQSCQDPVGGVPVCTMPAWDQIAQRLDKVPSEPCSIDSTSDDSRTPAGVALRHRWYRQLNFSAIGLGLAMAASLLLMAVAQIDFRTTRSEISVDLSNVIDRYAAEPAEALAQLKSQYAGKTVDATELRKLLGYDPITAADLPADVQLVSTSVLHLPVCSCKAGKCSCGPAGCNCAAMLCRRSDGSDMLVLEHCNSDKVALSKRPVRLIDTPNKRMQLYGADQHLTASWVTNDHRLTAIGLRSESEAENLNRP